MDRLHALLLPVLSRLARGQAAQVTDATRLEADLGIDSLAAIDLAVALEDETGIRVPDDAVERFVTVGDVAAFLRAHGAAV